MLHPARIIPTGNLLKENRIPYQEIELITADGNPLAAWYTPPRAEGNHAVILIAHGYSASRPEAIYVMLAQHGYGVLAWDFRAHGKSGGDVSTLGYYEQLDLEAALDYALAQPNVQHIGGWGGSMGAATLILTAGKRPEIEAVVSDSSFTSLAEALHPNAQIKFMQPFMLFFWEWSSGVNINKVSPLDEIENIGPRAVFIIDGWERNAGMLNTSHRLFDAAREPKQIWVEEGVQHLGMYSSHSEEYTGKVIAFFDEYLLTKNP